MQAADGTAFSLEISILLHDLILEVGDGIAVVLEISILLHDLILEAGYGIAVSLESIIPLSNLSMEVFDVILVVLEINLLLPSLSLELADSPILRANLPSHAKNLSLSLHDHSTAACVRSLLSDKSFDLSLNLVDISPDVIEIAVRLGARIQEPRDLKGILRKLILEFLNVFELTKSIQELENALVTLETIEDSG